MNLAIIDNFAPNPEEIRAFALEHDFGKVPVYDGVAYPGYVVPKDAGFTDYYEGIMSVGLGRRVRILMQIFAKLEDGKTTPQWIHSDNTCASHAAVHYLCDHKGQGTQFWKHKQHQVESLEEWLEKQPLTAEDATDIFESGQSEDEWERTDYAESKFNRLIYYPSRRFHSRASKEGVGVGETARLTLATFFDFV
jgi:hypothetical protein